MKTSPTGAVALVARRRLTTRWRGLVAAGLLLGAGFGVSLASLAAARTTASAYERILVAADAPDAAVAHGRPLEEAVQSLDTVDGIVGQRAYAGFRGVADGVDPALTTGLLASAGDHFPLELPALRAGRLPDADAPDEVFVSATVADGAGVDVGDHLTFHLFTPDSDRTASTTVTVTGIGTVPVELVRDETTTLGVVVFTARSSTPTATSSTTRSATSTWHQGSTHAASSPQRSASSATSCNRRAVRRSMRSTRRCVRW